MTLALEEQRKRAEETLTLLAAAEASAELAKTEGSDKETLLAQAQKILTQKDDEILKAARDMALLNQQMTALRGAAWDACRRCWMPRRPRTSRPRCRSRRWAAS